jgi:serine/threonine-protein kinase
MIEFTPESFSQRVLQLGIADARQIDVARSELGSGDVTTEDLIRMLQRHGLLTTLQLDKILRGDSVGYFFGDYKILYLIGAGTFARVYRASKPGTSEIFAVKVLRKRFRDEISELEQFLREGRMGLRLRHPNIVQINEVVPDVRNPFMVMEFVEGQTLRELIDIRKTLEPMISLKLLYDVASGLDYAAGLGISHRDMKMSNVLVSSDGKAKLVDFGLAALADTSNPDKVADCPNARAIDYASLERGTGVRKDDPRSDIYFAGCILYHMLSGKPPLTETRDRMARLNISRFHEVPPIYQVVKDLPLAVAHLVNRTMEFDPEKRIQSAKALRAEIKTAMERLNAPIVHRVGENGEVPIEYGDEAPSSEGDGRIVMLVESKIELQNAIRDRLKKRGYRVLVISDPARALQRFDPNEDVPADCVLFSAHELGNSALEAFNEFATNEHTAAIPAVLLVDKKQQYIIGKAKMDTHRRMLALPLKVKELRTMIRNLLAQRPKREVF